jgi:two-component system NtrC family sensor kinase
VLAADGRVVDANSAATRLYGERLIGRAESELVEASSVQRTPADQRNVTRYTAVGRRLDGTTFPEEVDVRPIEPRDGGDNRRLAIVRDLTERRRMQAELIQAQKMEAIGLLVAGVAHELNNPLASIIAFSQLIRTDPGLPADLRTQADLLVQEADRTRVIVTNLLDFARQRPPERVRTELRPLIDSSLDLQSYVLRRAEVRVEVDIPDNLLSVAIDRSQFQQVLLNLTMNAAQAIAATGRPGRIRISASATQAEDDARVRIEIEDDGPGVSPEIADRLFVPFVTTKPPGEGTGLGLSVSFGIVAGHGGSIRHEPNAAGGATFVIELPTDVEASGPDHSGGRAEAGVTGAPGWAATAPPTAARGAVRVLVLDDEPAIREFLRRVLARAGHEAVVAASGVAALEIVRTNPPDAILCDHRMAGMTGIEFHAAVAAINPELARRFAFMSGDVLNPELREFATAQRVELLAKPFDIAGVDEIVRRLVADRRP